MDAVAATYDVAGIFRFLAPSSVVSELSPQLAGCRWTMRRCGVFD